ncbi:hypothetical protein TG4357_00867 [Thalassovita gelatinovora]|uniref:Uncharacterized protein n=1 Tax=Thalassovita gelatinovora TaxID=53501 RepID=A0A0P1F717_THAGE|nr:hypothetical protein [Thalassovita gelatinovora]QIZ82230.1 hypothetical protein HFZ77_17985 [Thalassovita gelatinovora]CUH63749.1 hypothetical protein TG4357_00867 [Thalassovita gelatinovora]SEQ98278.1 hypothetical protein SAMN04488043_11285 [Thalassovita gelatinovora]
MKQSLLMEKYPIFELQIAKSETSCASVDDIIAVLKTKIDAHPKVADIAVFDHYAHTQSIDGTIADSVKAAKNIVFCFGVALPNPHVLAVRPRSIGVADMGDHFHVGFMEPPMEVATTEMESWCKALADKPG